MTDKNFLTALVKFFGADFDGQQAKLFFKEWKFDAEYDPDMFPYRFIETKSRGVALQFEHNGSDDEKSGYQFCSAFFYDEGVEGYSAFKGELPSNVRFEYTRDQVRAKLGEPSFSGPHLDRWDYADRSLAVDYSSDKGESVAIVILSTKFEH